MPPNTKKALQIVFKQLKNVNGIPGMNTFERHNAINKLTRTLYAPQLNFRSVNGNPSPLDIIIISKLKNAYPSYISNIRITHPKNSTISSLIKFGINLNGKIGKSVIAVYKRPNYNSIKFNPTFSYAFVTNGDEYVALTDAIGKLMRPIGGRSAGSVHNHVILSLMLNKNK